MKRSKKETRGGGAKQTLAVEMRGDAWEIVHPRCARRRREDIEEIADMLASGEIDIAKDELVWLLSECPDFLEAHVQLGAIAMESDDLRLARGHFGRAYELSLRALEAAGNPRPLPYALRGNESFWEASKGLLYCLVQTGRRPMALDAWKRLQPLDPSDPLGIAQIVGTLKKT